HQRRVARLYGSEVFDHRVGDRALERAVLLAVEFLLDVGDRRAGRRRIDLDQVRHARLRLAVVPYLRSGIGDRGLDLLLDLVGRVEHEDRALRRILRLRHLALGPLEIHDAGADGRERRLGNDEGLPEARVETDRDVARELDVLALVVADGNLDGV